MVAKIKNNKKKQPEEATPWAELKEGVLNANKKQKVVEAPNQKTINDRQKNYEKFLSDDIKQNAKFDTLKGNKKGKQPAKKQDSDDEDDDESEEDSEDETQAPTKTAAKPAGNSKKVAVEESEEESDSDDSDEESDEDTPTPVKNTPAKTVAHEVMS